MSGPIEHITPAPVGDRAAQHLVRMRDDVHLATDVYLPAGGSPTETVLVRLPYDKNSRYVFFDAAAERFTDRGYAVVVQDVRGKFRSEGDTLAFLSEAADGHDTIQWIVEQDWSNGRVGMFGDSYYGFTQWAAVSSGHPALRAIVPRVTSADLAGGPPSGGPVGEVEWLTTADYLVRNWTDHDRYELDFDWTIRPLREAVEDAYRRIGGRSLTLDFVIPEGEPGRDEPDRDDSTAVIYPDGHPFDGPPIPALHCVGWFDNLAIPSMRDFTVLRATPGWAEVQYLDANSTDHENYFLADAPVTDANDHLVDPVALERLLDAYTGPALDFFDVHLKEVRPASSLPRVRWHLGHDTYHESDSWPPAGTRQLRLHLGNLAAAVGTGGRLADAAPSESQEVSWTHGPEDLVPSAVSDSFSFLYDYPDEATTGERADVLVFTGPAAVAPLDLAGPVDLWVTVTSTGPSTDVFAKVLDLAPDGSAHMIVRGQGRLRDPQRPRLVHIELGHTGYRLRPGHRLRLHLASSDFPEFLPDPGTGENPWLATETSPTVQTLTTGSDRPAHLLLTVLPGLLDDTGGPLATQATDR